MMSSRATSGVEVQVDLAGRRVRSGLEDELRDAVRTGRLAPGTRLPSSRTLARDLGISRNTVADAFGQLVAEGWLVTRHGAGTWVADRPNLPDPADPADGTGAPDTTAPGATDTERQRTTGQPGTAPEPSGIDRTTNTTGTAGTTAGTTSTSATAGTAGTSGTSGTSGRPGWPGPEPGQGEQARRAHNPRGQTGSPAGAAGRDDQTRRAHNPTGQTDSPAGTAGRDDQTRRAHNPTGQTGSPAGAGGREEQAGRGGSLGGRAGRPAVAGGREELVRRVRFDLTPGMPDLAAFPRTEWLAAARRALAVAPDDTLGYGDPRGLALLREALAGYLARARRVTVSPGRVVVCAGFTQALELVAGVLRARGTTTLAVEAYGHRLHRDILHHAGLATVALPVDDRGAVIDTLDGRTGLDSGDAPGTGRQGGRRVTGGAGTAGGVLLTPAHQFPLGVALDPTRRRHVVGWAAEAGALVIEDDYDGEFRYDRQAVGAVQSLAPDHVVYAGTAAKSLAPGLRLAWLVLPAGLVDEVVATMRFRGIFPSAIEQLTLAELLTSGRFDRHVRRARLAYRRRRDRLVAALAREVPAVQVSGIAAGLHALVHLPGAASEPDVVARAAADHGLALEGLGAYTEPGHEQGPALVVGYATPPDHAYTATLARLTATLTPFSR